MKIGVNLSINVEKIDKSKLYKGKKGTYLDMTAFIGGETDEYGNHGMITQALSKEDRESGKQGAILGNSKIFWRDNQDDGMNQDTGSNGTGSTGSVKASPIPDFDDDLPF